MANRTAFEILSDLWVKSASLDGWYVGRFVLMPDHVHLFASPAVTAKSRPDWLKTWKSVSSRQIAHASRIVPPIWQPDTFDHILRSAESYDAKWAYVLMNPVRSGLVARPEDWPWAGEIHRLDTSNAA